MGLKVLKMMASTKRWAIASSLLLAAACVNVDGIQNQINSVGNAVTGGGSKSATVALLLPYSDSNAGVQALSRSAENAARLALAGVADNVTIELKVYDTQGSPTTAASVATQAVAEGADVIVGPLFAEAAIAAGKAVQPSGVNVLALSNNVNAAGGNVYVLGNTFENIADRLVSYAGSQGKQRALIVHARTSAEVQGRDALRQALSDTGISSATAGYEFSQQALVEASGRIANLANNNGVDVMFLTANYASGLSTLAQLLPERGVNPQTVQYGGTTSWNAQPQAFQLPGIQGGWFTMPSQAKERAFNNRFQSTYGTAPHPVASIAFDGIAAVAGSLAAGGRQPLSGAGLTRSRGFEGATGIFRLKSNGRVQRGLSVATIQGNQVVVIDNAPSSFGGFGS
ncbi:MAG: penicillin-binding protein activator [Planktomarina sp.]